MSTREENVFIRTGLGYRKRCRNGGDSLDACDLAKRGKLSLHARLRHAQLFEEYKPSNYAVSFDIDGDYIDEGFDARTQKNKNRQDTGRDFV